jgi:putative DNA primase/helicase
MENHNSLMSALHAISPDDRDTWVQVGMALNAEFGDGGFEMWDSWSRRSDRYKESSTRAVWRSFKRSGIGIGSLYLLAQQAGWQGEIPPLPQAHHWLDAARRQAERESELHRMWADGRRRVEREAKGYDVLSTYHAVRYGT